MIQLTPPTFLSLLHRTPEEIEFMEKNMEVNMDAIFSLQKGPYAHLIPQLFSRNQIKTKLPFLFCNPHIVYPASLSLEQSSSEKTAMYKAGLFNGKNMIDLNGGMGIDTYFFSKQFESVIYVERNRELAEITSHNMAILNQLDIQFASGYEAKDVIRNLERTYDLIYLDPARRNDKGGKLVMLEDCEPDILQLLPELYTRSNTILIKTSPLLDIHAAALSLNHVRNVHVVSVNNECKELLFHLEHEYEGDFLIHAVNIERDTLNQFEFFSQSEKSLPSEMSANERYLYEPNASILKAGAFKSIAAVFHLKKIHIHTHLYTSDQLIQNFPGRCFEILASTRVDRKEIAQWIPDAQANVSIRNFPGSVAELKKKLGLKDGGDYYVFGTTNHLSEKIILITKKLVF